MTATQGLCSSIATTFNTPLLLGGPASVITIRQSSWRIKLDLVPPIRSYGVGFLERACASPWGLV